MDTTSLCCTSGSYKLVIFFADMENDIYPETNDGRNCLSIAALGGHLKLCKTLIYKHNFDIHVTDNDNWTAQHYSARNGSYGLVTYFARRWKQLPSYCSILWAFESLQEVDR